MFTKEELQLLVQIINTTQITGTIQTLPTALLKMVELQKKILAEIEGPLPERGVLGKLDIPQRG